MANNPPITMMWRRLGQPGAEYCELTQDRAETWRLNGTVICVLEGRPAQIRYQVACDHAWRTREVEVNLDWNGQQQTMLLSTDGEARWQQDGDSLNQLWGCYDIDLSVTPSTNTLPIRRLGLKIGESAQITAAYLAFPNLEVSQLEQRYTRLGNYRYRYESLDGRGTVVYQAELIVNRDGLVEEYEGGWEVVSNL